MKKLLFLFTTLLFISCSSEDTDLGLDDPNKPLSEKLSSLTAESQLFYEQYSEKTYNVRYFMQNGYVINYRTVSDDWGNNGENVKCICPEFHYDHTISEIVVLNDTANSFSWSNSGRVWSLEYNGSEVIYKRDNGTIYATSNTINSVQLDDYLSKASSYTSCHD